MTTTVLLLLACGAAPAAVVATVACAHARAAAGRRARRDACPFEDDDDEARPLVLEVAGVVRESAAVLRAAAGALAPPPGGWRSTVVAPGRGPVVVLVPPRPALAGAMTRLGRHLCDALDASIHLEPRGAVAVASRAARVAELARDLAREAPGRTVVLVGHGTGGLVARRAAAVLGGPRLRVVTIATDHREHAGPEPIVDRVEVVNVYSLHDAIVSPPDRAYLAGAYNVAVRDEGHVGLLFGDRLPALVAESLTDLAPRAATA